MERRTKGKTEDSYDLKQLFFILLNRFWIIALVSAGMAAALFAYSRYMIAPVYQSETKIYVLNREDSSATTYSDLLTSAQLTKDYQVMIQSRPVLETVIRKLKLDIGSEELLQMIAVTALEDTRILQISVVNGDPALAKSIVDTLAKVSSDRISEVMDIDKVSTVEEGNLPSVPVSPNILMNAVMGGIAGIVISCFVILLVYMFDDTIKGENDIEKYLGLGILGLIPVAEEADKHGKRTKKEKTKHTEEKGTKAYAEREDRYKPEDGLSKQ